MININQDRNKIPVIVEDNGDSVPLSGAVKLFEKHIDLDPSKKEKEEDITVQFRVNLREMNMGVYFAGKLFTANNPNECVHIIQKTYKDYYSDEKNETDPCISWFEFSACLCASPEPRGIYLSEGIVGGIFYYNVSGTIPNVYFSFDFEENELI